MFFIILLFSAIFLLAVVLISGFLLTPPTNTPTQSGWIDNMWGCMGDWAGGQYPTNDPFSATFGILLIVAIAVIIVALAGVTYFYLFPEIRTNPKQIDNTSQKENDSSSYVSVLKTLNDDELKVIEVLKKHDGVYLQKYIRHEAKLSRLKTHRVLARFAERGMVSLKKTGNTNEVTLAEWLQ